MKCIAGQGGCSLHFLHFDLLHRLGMFFVCFEKQNVQISPSRWLFSKRHVGRFEWVALLAYRRMNTPVESSSVSLEDIARLPSWAGRTRHHIGTNVGRYLRAFESDDLGLVEAQTKWAGPYELQLAASAIRFDLPLEEVRKRLRIPEDHRIVPRAELLRFTLSYSRAQWLYFQGRLVQTRRGGRTPDSAYERLLRMLGDPEYSPRLRLLACIAAVRVLFRLGRFRIAREALLENAELARSAGDNVLQAQYYLSLAWSMQRASSGTESNRATERALSTAHRFATVGGDRASLGLLAYRRSGFLTKKGRHEESIRELLYAIEAALITGNLDELQAYCGDAGSVVHRLGPQFYREARSWLLLGIAIARWMKIGRDDAHGEMILGKIYSELGRQPRLAQFWLRRAERIAERSGNQVNLADVKMVWAFWHRRFGKDDDLVETLAQALIKFRSISEFDCQQKERYMARKFPSVWHRVLELAGSNLARRSDSPKAARGW